MVTSDLKVGQTDAGTLDVSEKPPSFYVAADFMFGDIASSDRPLWQNVFLKAFVKGSSRPQESIGIGLGLRGKYLDWPALNFETFSPFVAATWTRVVQDGKISRQRDWRLGVSLNLDKAVKWLK